MQKGQSMIELLVAMGVFVIVAATIAFLVVDSYISSRAGEERTKATFLAEQGLEQARLTRDNSWGDLVSIAPETIEKFTRTVTVENIDPDRKKVTSQVTWQLTQARPQEVSLITYLTNWSKPSFTCSSYCLSLPGYIEGNCRKSAPECRKNLEVNEPGGDQYCIEPRLDACCCVPTPSIDNCNDYCISLGYSNGSCTKNPKQCEKDGGIYESGGDPYCSGDSCCCQ